MFGRSSSSRPTVQSSTSSNRLPPVPGVRSSSSLASPSTGSQTVTIDELLQREPTLRIRLRERAQQFIDQGQEINFRELLEFIFKSTESTTTSDNNEQNNNNVEQQQQQHRTTEENVTILRGVFQQFKDTVNRYEGEVLRDFEQLTAEQQEQVVAQYEEATEFIGDLFDWLDKVFDYAVEKVRAGHSIERDAVRKLFGSVRDELNKLFEQ